jgi:YD repeat-containing protein
MGLIFEIWGNNGVQHKIGVGDLPDTRKSWHEVWNETAVSRFNTAAVVFKSGWTGSDIGIHKELRIIDLETSETLFGRSLDQNQFILRSRDGDTKYSIGTWSENRASVDIETFTYSLPPASASPKKLGSTITINFGNFGPQVSDNGGYQLQQYLDSGTKKFFIFNKWVSYGNNEQDVNGNFGKNEYVIKEVVTTKGGINTLIDFNNGVLPEYGQSKIDWIEGLIYKNELYLQTNTDLAPDVRDQHYFKFDTSALLKGTPSAWSEIDNNDYWEKQDLVSSFESVIRDGENSYDLRKLEPADTGIWINQSESIPSGGKIVRYDANTPGNNAGYERWVVYRDGVISAQYAFKKINELPIRSIADAKDGYVYFNHLGVQIPADGDLSGLKQSESIQVFRIAVGNVESVLGKLNTSNSGIQTISGVERVATFSRETLNNGETPASGSIAIIQGFIGDATGSIVISMMFNPSLNNDTRTGFVSRIERDGSLSQATALEGNSELREMVSDGAHGYNFLYIDPRDNSNNKLVAYVDVATGNLTYIDPASVQSLIGDYKDLFDYVKTVGRVPIGFSVAEAIMAGADTQVNGRWTEYLDDAGKVLYRSQTYEGQDREGAEFTVVSIYDAKYALVESIYTDDTGYRLKTLYGTVDLIGDAGNIIGVKTTTDFIEYNLNQDEISYTQSKYWSESSTYDAAGRLTLRTTYDGQMTTTYDDEGVFISSEANIGSMAEVVKRYDGDGGTNITGYSYVVDDHNKYIFDERSKLIAREYTTSDDEGRTTIRYDADWQITGGSFEAESNSQRVSYEYVINKEVNQNSSYKVITEYQYANFTYSKSIYSYDKNDALQGYEIYDGIRITKFGADGVQKSTEIDLNRWVKFVDADGVAKYKNKDTLDPYLTKLDLEGNFLTKTKTWENTWTDANNGISSTKNISYYDQFGKQIGWENTYESEKSNSYNKNLTYEVERKSADGTKSIFLKVVDNQNRSDRVDDDPSDASNAYSNSYRAKEVEIYNSDRQYLGTASIRGGVWKNGNQDENSWEQATFNINTYSKEDHANGGYSETTSYKQLSSLTAAQINYVDQLSYELITIAPDSQSESYNFHSYTTTYDSSGIQVGGGYEYDYVNSGTRNRYGYDYTYVHNLEGGTFNEETTYERSISYHYDYYSWTSEDQKIISSSTDATYYYGDNNQLIGYSTFDGLTTTLYDGKWSVISQKASVSILESLVGDKVTEVSVDGINYYDYNNGNNYYTRFDDDGILCFRIYKYINGNERYLDDGITPDSSRGYWSKYESVYSANWISMGGSYLDSNGWGYEYTNERRDQGDEGYSYLTHYEYRDGSEYDTENFYSASGQFIKSISFDGLVLTEYDSAWRVVSKTAKTEDLLDMLGDQVQHVGSSNGYGIYEYQKNSNDSRIVMFEDQGDGTANLTGYAYQSSWENTYGNSVHSYSFRTNYDSNWVQIGGSYEHTSTDSQTLETQLLDGYTYTVTRELNVTTHNERDGGAYENITYYAYKYRDASGDITEKESETAEIYNSSGQYIGSRYTDDVSERVYKYESIRSNADDGSYSIETNSSTRVNYFADSSLDYNYSSSTINKYDSQGNFIGASGTDSNGGSYSYEYSSEKMNLTNSDGIYAGYEQSYELNYIYGGNDYAYKYLYSSSGQFSGYESAFFNQAGDEGFNSSYDANWSFIGQNSFKYDAISKTLEITDYDDNESVYLGQLFGDPVLSDFNLNSSGITIDSIDGDTVVTLDNNGNYLDVGDQFKIILLGVTSVDEDLISSGKFLSL